MTQKARIFHLPRPARLAQHIRARLYPPQIETVTVRQVLERYGLELTQPPRNLPFGRRNRNVVVYTSAGKKVLKLYKKKWQAPAIRYEHSILTRLAELDFSAPRLVATRDQETFVRLGQQHFALFDFVEGANFTSSFVPWAHRQKLLALAGETLARFHRHLAGFLPQGQHHLGYRSYSADRRRNLAWHLHILDQAECLRSAAAQSRHRCNAADRVQLDWLVGNRNYIRERLCQLDESLEGAPLPRLVIHGDYGLHNLQFQRHGTVTVHDFELARLEWRLIDLVLVLSRLPFARSPYFMAAYQTAYPLSSDEWHFLPQVWQFYKLQGAVQSWYTFFERGGSARLASARERVQQADWAATHKAQLLQLRYAAGKGAS